MTTPSAGAPAASLAPLPTVVIGGYLGAGKTTLVNHLLRRARTGTADGAGAAGGGAPRRIAVLVNDFGEISIDADLIEGAAGEVLALAGGCICCSFGADLVGTLAQVAKREPRPDAVLIETSGVALPAAVARTARLVPQVALEGIVVVADAASVHQQARQRHVGETVRQQLQEADLLVIGKTDLVGAADVAALRSWLKEVGAAAPAVTMPCAEAEADALEALVFGLPARRLERPAAWLGTPGGTRPAGPEAAAARYAAGTRRFEQPVDVPALARALQAEGVVRAKGVLLGLDGRWHELHVMGRRADIRPAAARPASRGTADAPSGHLVTIELRGETGRR